MLPHNLRDIYYVGAGKNEHNETLDWNFQTRKEGVLLVCLFVCFFFLFFDFLFLPLMMSAEKVLSIWTYDFHVDTELAPRQ